MSYYGQLSNKLQYFAPFSESSLRTPSKIDLGVSKGDLMCLIRSEFFDLYLKITSLPFVNLYQRKALDSSDEKDKNDGMEDNLKKFWKRRMPQQKKNSEKLPEITLDTNHESVLPGSP
jgi:hypothetical protein